MRKIVTTIILFCGFVFILEAQPQICGEPAVMTSYCKDACIICDINGYTGVNSSTVAGVAPPGFCTSYVHNIKWIAFQAGSTDLTLEVSVTNCKQGGGLEIGIYKSLDCKTFELMTNCDTDIPNNTKQTFTNIKPLEIGQYYYFVMDGSNGDVCNWTIKVLKGTTEVTPLDDSGIILGETFVCPGVDIGYKTTPVKGAINFDWTIDGQPFAQEDSVTINWTVPGTHVLCVTASNICDKATPSCQIINVKAIDTTFINQILCEGECLSVANTQLCKTGNYVFDLITEKGCDSTIVVNLIVNPVYTTNLALNICEGDTIFVLGQPYDKEGVYVLPGKTWQGCDSTVNLDLKLIVCNIKGNSTAKDANCAGENSGIISFAIENGTPPFTYNYSLINSPIILGTGNINALAAPEMIANLIAGNYIINIQDNFGNSLILLQSVGEPKPIQSKADLSGYNGYNISCYGGNDGNITVNSNGGTLPHSYLWNNAENTNGISGLNAGLYIITITDASGCTLVNAFNLSQPAELKIVNANFNNPDCSGFKTGSIELTEVEGGIKPYTFDMNGKGFSDITKFENLGNGQYTWTVKDANGCETKISGNLIGPEIPVIGLSDDLTIDLGESQLIQTFLNVEAVNILWTGNGLNCYNCLEPIATPYNTTNYILTVGSKDNCFTTDSIKITVIPNLKLYIPNAFSPNGDGVNDRFAVFAGMGVKSIKLLNVYSRWGSLLFEQKDAIPFGSGNGWDGTLNGKALDPGVYVWYAEVEFLDGQFMTYKGDVNLLR